MLKKYRTFIKVRYFYIKFFETPVSPDFYTK
ncbi:unknown [[Mannheimia] succiniciproducens MBEL55E]|uniref:Uncharacterized protein n=1 Tax=Mannheimia succiniciproducens (strain KCTC 0769BP / MBEL55E) TaxID=221988 RepID=Q65V49_MANSM|nr:unknown [[Mannheimia] succiniciproducens MBEL55E]